LSAVDLFALTAWPLAALGIWIARKAVTFAPEDFRRKLWAGTGILLLIGPLLVLVFLFPHHSAVVLVTEYGLMIGFGVLLFVIAWRTQTTRLKSIAIVVTGFLLVGGGLWHLGGDFLIRRLQVEGYVSDKRLEKRREPCARCRMDYYVYLGGRRYAATARVFQTIETGQRVRAKIGRASRRIVWFETRPR
jgi:hypothetical protein